MIDNDIHTFELDFFQTRMGLAKTKLGETHKLLKHPSFGELNRMISDYPSSPHMSSSNIKSESCRARRAASTSRGTYERSPYTEEEHYKECTFKPKISEMLGKENKKLPLAEKVAILSKSKKEIIEQREKLKRQQELQQAVSFNYTPNISQYTAKQTVPLEDRFKHEKLRIEQRERLKRLQDQERDSECTFKPQITKRKLVSQVPLFQRIEEVQVEKLKKYTKLRQKYEHELSFKPSINEKSRNISNQRKMLSETRTSSSHVCLSRTHSSKQSFNQDLSTFRLPTRDHYEPTKFLDRQGLYSARAAKKLKEKVEESIINCSFTPSINRVSSIMAEACESGKTILQKARKLSDGNLEKIKVQEGIREEFYQQFSHSPEIDERSRRIGRSSSIEKLVQNTGKDKAKERKIQIIRQQEIENCSFTPGINLGKQFSHVKSSYKQGTDVLRNIEKSLSEKEGKSKEIKSKSDYSELKKCSFKPEVMKTFGRIGSLSTVKGLERHFELKETAKKIAKDKYERELKVFCQRPPSSYTSRL